MEWDPFDRWKLAIEEPSWIWKYNVAPPLDHGYATICNSQLERGTGF